jgi:hypothetical protein
MIEIGSKVFYCLQPLLHVTPLGRLRTATVRHRPAAAPPAGPSWHWPRGPSHPAAPPGASQYWAPAACLPPSPPSPPSPPPWLRPRPAPAAASPPSSVVVVCLAPRIRSPAAGPARPPPLARLIHRPYHALPQWVHRRGCVPHQHRHRHRHRHNIGLPCPCACASVLLRRQAAAHCWGCPPPLVLPAAAYTRPQSAPSVGLGLAGGTAPAAAANGGGGAGGGLKLPCWGLGVRLSAAPLRAALAAALAACDGGRSQ